MTIHDHHTIKLLEPQYVATELPKITEKTGQKREGQRRTSRWLAQNELYQQVKSTPFGMIVLGRDIGSQVFYDRDYFCDLAKPMFEKLAAKPEAYSFQTAVLFRRVP